MTDNVYKDNKAFDRFTKRDEFEGTITHFYGIPTWAFRDGESYQLEELTFLFKLWQKALQVQR